MRLHAVVAVGVVMSVAVMLSGSDTRRLGAQTPLVALDSAAGADRIVVRIGGRPFTTYRYGSEFTDKPVFYPVLSPDGARVNREYPMVEGVAGESADHPHHQSMFFAYDEVNGTNFWNSSSDGRRIEHLDVTTEGSAIVARLAWKDADGAVVLEETKRVTFGGGADVSWMDHDITLAATRVPVSMGDTKEGAFAIRLNDSLKEDGGSGRYLNAEGLETEKGVWGKTSDWVAVRGVVREASGARAVTVAIFAPRSGLNAPPYWHARGYGLFAANPFGRKAFDPSAPERITRLTVGEQLGTRFRLAVYTGRVGAERLASDYAAIR